MADGWSWGGTAMCCPICNAEPEYRSAGLGEWHLRQLHYRHPGLTDFVRITPEQRDPITAKWELVKSYLERVCPNAPVLGPEAPMDVRENLWREAHPGLGDYAHYFTGGGHAL